MNFDTKEDVKIWIIKNQFGRRNLDTLSRVELAVLLKSFYKEKAKENQRLSEGRGQKGCQNSDNLKELDNYLSSEEHNKICITNNHDLTVKKPQIDTKKELAKIAGVSHDTFVRAEKILEKAKPEVIQAIKEKKTRDFSDCRFCTY